MTLLLYSRADTWLTQSEKREVDRPLRSFAHLVALSVKGVGYALGTLVPKRKLPGAGNGFRQPGSAVAMLALFFAGASGILHGETTSALHPLLPRLRLSAKAPSTPPSRSKT